MSSIFRTLLILPLVALLGGCLYVELRGPVSDASIEIVELRNQDLVLLSGTTTDRPGMEQLFGSETWSALGHAWKMLILGTSADIDTGNLEDDTLYLVIARHGSDEDSDGNGRPDTEPLPLAEPLHAIMTGAQLKAVPGGRISALTEAAWQWVAPDLHRLSDEEVMAALDNVAERAVSDVDGDGGVDYEDILRWSELTAASAGYLHDRSSLEGLREALTDSSVIAEPGDYLFKRAYHALGGKPDADRDGVPDDQDVTTGYSSKTTYEPGENIDIWISGVSPTGEPHAPEGRWRLMPQVYDQQNPNQPMIGFLESEEFPGEYDYARQEYKLSFPAPDYAGSFRIWVGMGCADFTAQCGEVPPGDRSSTVYFEVACDDGVDCSRSLDPAPGAYVTNSTKMNFIEAMLQRENGDLLILESEVTQTPTNNTRQTFIRRSRDGGATWETSHELPYSTLWAEMIETSTGELIVMMQCYPSQCVYRSEDGSNWSEYDYFAESDFVPGQCGEEECFEWYLKPNSLIELSSGGFMLSYEFTPPGRSDRDVFLRTTEDFVTWSDPFLVAGGEDAQFGSELLQTEGGSLVMAYSSRTDDRLRVMASNNGTDWEVLFSVVYDWVVEGIEPQLVQNKFGTQLFLGGGTEEGYLGLYGVPVDPTIPDLQLTKLGQNITQGYQATVLKDGGIGIAYSLYLNNQIDVFFEDLGVLLLP